MSERRQFEEVYQGYEIRVTAERRDKDSKWTVRINLRTPEGTELPTISDDDHSYSTSDMAITAGCEMGRIAAANR